EAHIVADHRGNERDQEKEKKLEMAAAGGAGEKTSDKDRRFSRDRNAGIFRKHAEKEHRVAVGCILFEKKFKRVHELLSIGYAGPVAVSLNRSTSKEFEQPPDESRHKRGPGNGQDPGPEDASRNAPAYRAQPLQRADPDDCPRARVGGADG